MITAFILAVAVAVLELMLIVYLLVALDGAIQRSLEAEAVGDRLRRQNDFLIGHGGDR